MNKFGIKLDTLGRFKTRRTDTLLFLGLNISPFLQLFLFPKKFLMLPMRGTITPEMKINIKTETNEPSKIVPTTLQETKKRKCRSL